MKLTWILEQYNSTIEHKTMQSFKWYQWKWEHTTLTVSFDAPKIVANASDFLHIWIVSRSKQITEIDARIRRIFRCLFVLVATRECAKERVGKQTGDL